MRRSLAAIPQPLFWFVGATFVLTNVGLLLGERYSARERTAWQAFKAAQHCRAETHEAGVPYKGATYGPRNEVTPVEGVTPSRTGWRCDDGQLHVHDDD